MTMTHGASPEESAGTLPPLLLRQFDTDEGAEPVLWLLSDHGIRQPPSFDPDAGSRLFSLSDLASDTDEPLAAALAVAVDPGTVEVQSLALAPDASRTVVATRLIAAVADSLRAAGWYRLVVFDDGGDTEWTTLILAAGFRPVEGVSSTGEFRLELLL